MQQMFTTIFSRRNPILRAEFHYQRFVIQRGRNGTFWIVLAALLVIPAIIGALVFSAFALAGINLNITALPPWAASIEVLLQLLFVALLVVNLSLYPVVTLITLGLSSNSIRREKVGHTWDVLRLTDIDGNALVFGKWWASLRALLGDQVMVTVLRMGLIASYLVFALPWFTTQAGYLAAPTNTTALFLALFPFTLAYGVLDSALTAAFGVLATIPDDAEGAIVGGIAIVGRIFVSGMAGALLLYVMYQLAFSVMVAFAAAFAGLLLWMALVWLTLWTARRLIQGV